MKILQEVRVSKVSELMIAGRDEGEELASN